MITINGVGYESFEQAQEALNIIKADEDAKLAKEAEERKKQEELNEFNAWNEKYGGMLDAVVVSTHDMKDLVVCLAEDDKAKYLGYLVDLYYGRQYSHFSYPHEYVVENYTVTKTKLSLEAKKVIFNIFKNTPTHGSSFANQVKIKDVEYRNIYCKTFLPAEKTEEFNSFIKGTVAEENIENKQATRSERPTIKVVPLEVALDSLLDILFR